MAFSRPDLFLRDLDLVRVFRRPVEVESLAAVALASSRSRSSGEVLNLDVFSILQSNVMCLFEGELTGSFFVNTFMAIKVRLVFTSAVPAWLVIPVLRRRRPLLLPE